LNIFWLQFAGLFHVTRGIYRTVFGSKVRKKNHHVLIGQGLFATSPYTEPPKGYFQDRHF